MEKKRNGINFGKFFYLKSNFVIFTIFEIGIDGDIISEGGMETREITSVYVYFTLRISMETLRNLIAPYSPDTIIIEP